MNRYLKSLFDRFAMSRIDRALDDGVPLTGWTAWYVRRNPELRSYHEQMLEMELELRFPEDETDSANVLCTAPTYLHAASEKPNRHVPLTVAVVLFFGLGIVSFFLPSDRNPRQQTASTPTAGDSEEEPSIDLALLFDTAPALDFSFELPERRSPLDDSVASVVRFTQQPLESTLALLESAHIIIRQPLGPDDL